MKKLTFEEYKEIGNDFKLLNDDLVNLIIKIGNALPKKHAMRILHAHKVLNQVRSDVENAMYSHYPKEANTDIFYGKR